MNEMMENEKKMMDGKMENEYAKLREDPYFPEKLPKICNLLALLQVLSEILVEIVEQIKPNHYGNYQYFMRQTLLRIRTINILKGQKLFISNHYKRALSQVCVLWSKEN